MPENKPRYANFPEQSFKVIIGPNINAATTKALGRLSIGTYEMSFVQQERGTATGDACKSALNVLSRATGMTMTVESHRDYVCTLSAANTEHKFQIWVTTPFELTQSGHIIWVKFTELGGEGKVGIAFKLSTSFSIEDVANLLKQAQKSAIKLPEGEPYTIKGNPPPRFAKKVAAPAEGAAQAAPADGAAQPAGDTAGSPS
jgi:hypothetical protein